MDSDYEKDYSSDNSVINECSTDDHDDDFL